MTSAVALPHRKRNCVVPRSASARLGCSPSDRLAWQAALARPIPRIASLLTRHGSADQEAPLTQSIDAPPLGYALRRHWSPPTRFGSRRSSDRRPACRASRPPFQLPRQPRPRSRRHKRFRAQTLRSGPREQPLPVSLAARQARRRRRGAPSSRPSRHRSGRLRRVWRVRRRLGRRREPLPERRPARPLVHARACHAPTDPARRRRPRRGARGALPRPGRLRPRCPLCPPHRGKLDLARLRQLALASASALSPSTGALLV